jgi:hypothetical protein
MGVPVTTPPSAKPAVAAKPAKAAPAEAKASAGEDDKPTQEKPAAKDESDTASKPSDE